MRDGLTAGGWNLQGRKKGDGKRMGHTPSVSFPEFCQMANLAEGQLRVILRDDATAPKSFKTHSGACFYPKREVLQWIAARRAK